MVLRVFLKNVCQTFKLSWAHHFVDSGGQGVNHEYYMSLALAQAAKAGELGEVPIGAVIVTEDGNVVAEAHNMKEIWNDATAHAEVIAIRQASQKLNRWRLSGCTLYVTIEPCPMCAGALVQSRVDRLVYGAVDPKAGAVDTMFHIVQHEKLNHRMEVISSVLAEECGSIMSTFFRNRRQKRIEASGL